MHTRRISKRAYRGARERELDGREEREQGSDEPHTGNVEDAKEDGEDERDGRQLLAAFAVLHADRHGGRVFWEREMKKEKEKGETAGRRETAWEQRGLRQTKVKI